MWDERALLFTLLCAVVALTVLRMMDLVDAYDILSLLLSITYFLRQNGETLFGPMKLFGRVLASPKSQILI
jgi:hypothetical protein